MNLTPKEPVDRPCEASTFEEAHQKNLARFTHEKILARDLYEGMKKDQDPHADSVDPVFWDGCIQGNSDAFQIYQEELGAMRERVLGRLKRVHENSTPVLASALPTNKNWWRGFVSTLEEWTKAIEANDPSRIVYW